MDQCSAKLSVSKCGPPYDGVIESESSVLSDIVGVVYGAVVTEIGEEMVKLEMAMFAEPSCLDGERLDYAGLAGCDSQVTLENITDQRGVFAGLVQHVPEECLTVFPPIYNLVLEMWKFQIVGGQPGPICCRQNSVLCMQVISCQLLTHECCTRFLHICCLVVSCIYLTPSKPENSMDSAQNIGLKNTCLQPVYFLTKRHRTEYSIWLVSLDLLQTFDRVHWLTLWNAMRAFIT